VGVALTLQSKGDQLLALLLTVLSNILGIITVPYLLKLYLSGTSANISPSDLVLKLVFEVLLPSIVGIVVRQNSTTVAAFMVKRKVEMGLFSNSNLICIVWMALSGSRETIIQQSGPEVICVLVTVIVQHCIYLTYNYNILRLLNVPLKQLIAVTIMASQKSSPVALAVIINIDSLSSTTRGLLTIPCILGQLSQIFIGSVVSTKFKSMVELEERESVCIDENIDGVVDNADGLELNDLENDDITMMFTDDVHKVDNSCVI